MLLLWSSVQAVDVWHHIHEIHEAECTAEVDHYCAPHAEVELCGLCSVIHGNAVQTEAFQASERVSYSEEFTCKEVGKALVSESETEVSRGPPSSL